MIESKNRKVGAFLSYFSIIITTVIQLIYTPFLIRMLGQSEYGLYSLINSVIGYLTLLDLGFGNALVVFTSKYRAQNKVNEEKKLQGMFFIIFLVVSFFVLVLGLILFFNVNVMFGDTMSDLELKKAKIMMLILTFNLVVTFIFNIYSCILNAYEKFVFQKIISIIQTIFKPLIMVPLLFFGFKSISLVIVITLSNLFIIFSNYIYCRRKLKIKIKYYGFDINLFKIILNYSIWIFLGIIVDKINWSVDQFVLGAVSGTVAVSLYSVASSINQLFINLSTAVNGVLLPKVSKMVAKEASNEEITEEFIKVGRIQYLIIFLMASGLVLFGKEFFIAWVGKEFVTSYYIALILILPLCIPLIQNLGISIMQAKNMHKFRSILYAAIAIVNIIMSIPLAKMYGGIGSAIGTALSLIVGNGIIINIYYYKKVGINVIKFWKEIIKMTVPNIIPILAIIMIMNFINLHGYLYLLVFGFFYTLFYCLICYFVTMNDYEKNIINKLLIKLHLKRV